MTLPALFAIALQCALRVAFVGDPQADGSGQVVYNQRSVYRELRSRKDLDLVIVMGDIVNDDVSLLDPSIESLDSLGVPWFSVPGNHDRDFYKDAGDGSPRDLSSWRRKIGYVDTTFVRKGIRFVLMNNVRTVGKNDYEGGFSEAQKQWLDSLVGISSREKQFVLAVHIPLSECRGRDSVMNILSPVSAKATVFCGHTHTVRRRSLDSGMEEIICGAVCGSWWRGVKGEDGLPYALMRCGSPRGYFVADFRRKGFRLDYKPVSRNDRASATVVDSSGVVAVNIFGGSEDGRVEYRIAGSGKWLKAERSSRTAPEVLKVSEWNYSKTREYRKAHKEEFIPMLLRPSPHLWEFTDPAVSPGDVIRVRYTDPRMKKTLRLRVGI
jgi:predicted phosphodiesterase